VVHHGKPVEPRRFCANRNFTDLRAEFFDGYAVGEIRNVEPKLHV
jgi:hypothetical protein